MFTPPPSPLPASYDSQTTLDSKQHVPVPPKTTRAQRYIALIIPVVILVLISITSRPTASVDQSSARAPHRSVHKAHRRQLNDPADLTPTSASSSTPPSTTGPQQLGAGTAATTVPSIPSPAWPVPTPFPQVFDSSLSFNFSTTSCSSFFDQFTSNITFRACRPFSLLLGTSAAFFEIQSNLTELTAVMGGTCDTPQTIDQCQPTMEWLASEIVKPAVCGTEVANQNAIVLQALNGFRTYDVMRQAGCLVNQRSNAYCFVEAVASTSPSDAYFYALPLGTPVPQKSTPSCSACTKSLMALYANQATDTTLPLSKVYAPAQKLATSACGADYALTVNGASRGLGVPWLSFGAAFGLIGSVSLLL